MLKTKDPLYKKGKADLSENLGNNFIFAVLYSENKTFAVTPNEREDLFGIKDKVLTGFSGATRLSPR